MPANNTKVVITGAGAVSPYGAGVAALWDGILAGRGCMHTVPELEALPMVRRKYPDTTVAVAGRSFLPQSLQGRLRQNGYEAYLAKLVRQHRLEHAVEFLGHLSADAMKQAYLRSNVFVLSSTMENSPNVLGEAMLLGLPCVAADVGGVSSLMGEGEGILTAPVSPQALAEGICRVFAMGEASKKMGLAARERAKRTHDPEKNLEDLLKIYYSLMEE